MGSLLKDKDGNVYSTVKLMLDGVPFQEWIVENLKTQTYADGTPIPNITDNDLWIADTSGAYCYYFNDIVYKNDYGCLYNQYAVNNESGLAYFERGGIQEAGWRVPSAMDVFFLVVGVLGGEEYGGDLKETGLEYWDSPNDGATDLYGFKARASGNRYIDVPTGDGFASLGAYADFLTTQTGTEEDRAYSFYLFYDNGIIVAGDFSKLCGQSVRCVRDL